MRALLAVLVLLAGPAWAGSVQDAQNLELERVRRQVANQVQLSAFDLIDELVYGWTREPVFAEPTPVVVAGVTVPVGLGTGMQALLENHLANVLLHHPSTNVQLVHCPDCTAVVVHSGPEGTIVSRGVDNPAVLAELGADAPAGATDRHALFVDVEAEGASLVLRARITRLTPDLPIVWSHTLAASASAAALLRDPTNLKSATEARQEYLDALRGRGNLDVPVRLAVRTYAQPDNNGEFIIVDGQPQSQAGTAPPPFVWFQTGVEIAPSDARAWTSSLIVGYSFIPQAYQGIMAQARVNRLLTGRVRSLNRPDLYLFAGASVTSVWGAATASFRKQRLTSDELLTDAAEDPEGPRTAFGTLQIGVDLRLGQRIGLSTYLENMPHFGDSPNFGRYVRVIGINFQSLGTEVTFWF